MEIELTPIEQKIAEAIAKRRMEANRKHKVNNTWAADEKRDYEIDLQGFGAEMAFARMANVYPDFTTQLRRGSPDCILHNGKRVDVKYTGSKRYGLLISTKNVNRQEIELYALMRGSFPVFKFVGIATADMVKAGELIGKPQLVQDNYHLTDDLLVPLEDVL